MLSRSILPALLALHVQQIEPGSLSAPHEKTTRILCRLVHGSHLLWEASASTKQDTKEITEHLFTVFSLLCRGLPL
ncbi:hypothetical protein Krac_6132 [Ktedonobacter racemifer DSM 44963]|uniref:Uncharacterized protein n=1 Tax=Ktedonobacter racemifer DSM 44963 TaxID=485913 RepID=D6TY04_KTERA|nr:hypothetical protein Krac_6132 [Ktedonobacter racemifer DSM 44963]